MSISSTLSKTVSNIAGFGMNMTRAVFGLKSSPAPSSNKTSSNKLSLINSQEQSLHSANEILGVIYRMIVQSRLDEIEQREKENSLLESKRIKDDKRNQELLDALSPGKTVVEKATIQPPKKPATVGKTETPKLQTPKTTTTTQTAAKVSIGTKVATGLALTSLGISAAAAISIKGETGATSKPEMIKKGSQIVPNDPKPGVFSYGIFGMNSAAGTVDQFVVQNPQFGFKEKPGTNKFNDEWRKVAEERSQELFDAQVVWHERNIIIPLKRDLQNKLPSNVPVDDKVITYMADRRIQYGKTLENDAFKYASNAANSTEFIQKITEFDVQTIGRAFPTYLSNHPGAERGLRNRIESRQRLTLQLTSDNNLGGKIDTTSKENKELKDGLKTKQSSGVNSTTVAVSDSHDTNTRSTEQKDDDSNAYQKKSRK